MAQSASSDNFLTASYSSPTNSPFSITESIPAPPTPLDPAGKSKYLESLRASVATAQDQINKELTTRMEEDKAREAAVGNQPSVDEEKEEENYGEEVQEEED
ncbi:gon7 family [Trichoderma arundinaceum]|uniref:EKC/KEOPS complex subunit GON7 n=1 Tax=Trichoderma arundinaceum TaxID=490622 RepID=A0A395NUV1_TRIAR|nr:gon7 family [Trichoderma arundinaceum]